MTGRERKVTTSSKGENRATLLPSLHVISPSLALSLILFSKRAKRNGLFQVTDLSLTLESRFWAQACHSAEAPPEKEQSNS